MAKRKGIGIHPCGEGKGAKRGRKKPAASDADEVRRRCDPSSRGVHPDALRFGVAPSSASTCVDCGCIILKGSARWGVAYAGNPLPERVVPLYGSHPMVMWCHARCGLAYYKLPNDACPAARTCHMCEDVPDPERDGGIRVLCGGPDKGKKVRSHAFHLSCWRRAVLGIEDGDVMRAIMRDPETIGKKRKRGIGWSDLSVEQKEIVERELS
mmetsp:Transcript_2157/g.5153  ORF Transcript_2157/g.5153 Transcript_2157/m.5153 type:complete len:211 (+) Transcript_2157:78-710(+)